MAENKVKKFYFPNEENYSGDEGQDQYSIPQNPYQKSGFADTNVLYERADDLPEYRGSTANTLGFNPQAYDDAEEIARQIVGGSSVIVNLEHLIRQTENRLIAQRIIDYLCGVAFAKEITVRKINATTFLISRE